MVVFVHDFGNLRVETDGVATSNISLTNSYLVSCLLKIESALTSNRLIRVI